MATGELITTGTKALPLRLPESLLAYIIAFLCAYVKDFKEYFAVSKDFKRILQVALRPLAREIREASLKCGLDLRDRITRFRLDWVNTNKPFDEALFIRWCEKPISGLIHFQDASPMNIDRIFGFMVEDLEVYEGVFASPFDFDDMTNGISLFGLRDRLVDFIQNNYTTDDHYIKFLFIQEAVFGMPIVEEGKGVSYYYRPPADFDPLKCAYNDKYKMNCANILLAHKNFLYSLELIQRVINWEVFTMLSFIADMILFSLVMVPLLNMISNASKSVSIWLLVYGVLKPVMRFAFFKASPSWELIKGWEAQAFIKDELTRSSVAGTYSTFIFPIKYYYTKLLFDVCQLEFVAKVVDGLDDETKWMVNQYLRPRMNFLEDLKVCADSLNLFCRNNQ